MSRDYWDKYRDGHTCVLCDETEDSSVGLHLNLDNKSVCEECRETLSFDNYTGRHFDELIKPDKGRYLQIYRRRVRVSARRVFTSHDANVLGRKSSYVCL